MHIDLTTINDDFELSFLLHRLITHHRHLAWVLRFEAGTPYFIDGQSITLSHHLCLKRTDTLEDHEYQLPQYAAAQEQDQKRKNIGTLFLYASGLCYFQNEEKLLADKKYAFHHYNIDQALLSLHQMLDATNPWSEHIGISRVQHTKFPLPHLREHSLLRTICVNANGFSSINLLRFGMDANAAIAYVLLLTDRIEHYQKVYHFQKQWKCSTIDPTQLEEGTPESKCLAEFLSLLDTTQSYRLSEDTYLPFRGQHFKLTHRLISRFKYHGEQAFDVIKTNTVTEGCFGAIIHRVAILKLDSTYPELTNKKPMRRRIYKEIKPAYSHLTLDDEFDRTKHIRYLNPKNNRHLLFSMYAIPGVNLLRFFKSHEYQSLAPLDQITVMLQLAYKSYGALNKYIATNEKLKHYHGDIKPENMMVSLSAHHAMTMHFIDFDKDRLSQLFYPPRTNSKPPFSPKMDCYCLIRTLAWAFGDTHPIWKEGVTIKEFNQYYQAGMEDLLQPLFEVFEKHEKQSYLLKETVSHLKTLFMKLHQHENPSYPSAADIADEFKAIYNQHCAWLKANPRGDYRSVVRA